MLPIFSRIETMKYTLEKDLMPIIDGKVDVPNFKEVEIGRFVNNIASGGHSMLAKWGWAYDDGRHRNWAQYFLTPSAMGDANHGSFDGGGYVMIWSNRKEGAIVGRFMICDHIKVDGAGANHERGWHPGRCSKCGLDMTVDSSD
jgi:hypothetical protein